MAQPGSVSVSCNAAAGCCGEVVHDGGASPAFATRCSRRSYPPGWNHCARSLRLAGILAGTQLRVSNASAIATDLGVPQVIIGFGRAALGKSLPELVTTVQAQRRGESNLVVATCSAATCSTASSEAQSSDSHPVQGDPEAPPSPSASP
ncbi:hypothetical protein [Kribbella sancticallisti]|uniref:hypothetical protein n=1 Tax=Kribbella sancticallisti TaxID=460087 RepID=UPI003CD09868